MFIKLFKLNQRQQQWWRQCGKQSIHLFGNFISRSIWIADSRHVDEHGTAATDIAVWNLDLYALHNRPVVAPKTNITRLNVTIYVLFELLWLRKFTIYECRLFCKIIRTTTNVMKALIMHQLRFTVIPNNGDSTSSSNNWSLLYSIPQNGKSHDTWGRAIYDTNLTGFIQLYSKMASTKVLSVVCKIFYIFTLFLPWPVLTINKTRATEGRFLTPTGHMLNFKTVYWSWISPSLFD